MYNHTYLWFFEQDTIKKSNYIKRPTGNVSTQTFLNSEDRSTVEEGFRTITVCKSKSNTFEEKEKVYKRNWRKTYILQNNKTG